MLLDYCTFIGVGQAGGNVVRELDLNDIKTFFVNTSLEDLESLNHENSERLFHISGTKGMAKSRDLAKQIIETDSNHDIIAETIYKKYANSKIYFFVFSTAGGTGGGMTNSIMKAMKEMYPDKIINAVPILNHDDEDMIMQQNSIKCIKELKELYDEGMITNIQFLDNSKKDLNKKEQINKIFASLMTSLMTFENSTKSGNLDEQELEDIFSTKGILTIHELANKDVTKEIANIEKSSIYNRIFKNPTTQGLIVGSTVKDSPIKAMIRDSFGIAPIVHETVWEEEETIIISAGIDFSDTILPIVLKPLYDNYQSLKNKKKQIEEEMLKELNEVNFDINSMDFDSLDNGIKRTSTSQSSTKGRKRGRKVGFKAEMEKYGNK